MPLRDKVMKPNKTLLSDPNAQVTHWLCSYPLGLINKPGRIRKFYIPTLLKAGGFFVEGMIVN